MPVYEYACRALTPPRSTSALSADAPRPCQAGRGLRRRWSRVAVEYQAGASPAPTGWSETTAATRTSASSATAPNACPTAGGPRVSRGSGRQTG